ncbi:MAG TPA: PEP-CTERM sorting domain-containing protein, partial [Roseimicrobium sp.]|nr:PEP-CTERM sorting domain-containing protein [Roseimicrobium sp.]
WTSGNGASNMNITDGVFMQTGFTLATGLSSTKSTFMIGSTSYVNFISGGTGYLSLEGWGQSSFDALVTAGKIKIDGATASTSDFSFSTNGNQGIYGLFAPIPEPSTYGLVAGGLVLVGAMVRRRRANA